VDAEQTAGATTFLSSFGIPLASSLRFPGPWRAQPPHPDATAVVVGKLPVASRATVDGWRGRCEGRTFVAGVSRAGEYWFLHGGQTLFHLSADYRTLTGESDAEHSMGWWRVLLDSVLFTVGLLRGGEALHAGAVSTPAGAVAIVARSGAGKSTLLGELLREGYGFVSDDILFLDSQGDQLLAHPGPPLMTLPRQRASGAGTHLGDIGEEAWVGIPVVPGPVPLQRLVLLDPTSAGQSSMARVEKPLAPLIAHLLRFPRTREREFTRFSMASTIATRCEMWHLVTDMKTSPQRLAALAVRGLSS
jgi:hypothetical protein